MQLKCLKGNKTGWGDGSVGRAPTVKHEDPGSDPQRPCKSQALMFLPCNFSDGQWRQVDLWPISPEEMVNFSLNERPCLKK